eukprot:m.79330 g.79330  ORF g.79330 m.79330 type:complete len:508 (+) comp14153_c0_seq4:182-1705(+)
MSVKELVGLLEAEKLKEEKMQLQLARERAEQLKTMQLEAEAEARKAAEEEQRRHEEELAAERAKWHVDEDASQEEVAEMKRLLLQRLEKPKPKPVIKLQDIRTIVIDLGSGSIKAGFAGEDAPRVVMSAIVGFIKDVEAMDLEKHAHIDRDVYFGDEVWLYADVLEIKPVISRGAIVDYVLFERLIKHLLVEEMKIPLEELRDYPVLVTEPPLNPKVNRERICRLMFDTLDIAALFVANTSSLALFGTGNVTGVVVDIGYEVAISVAVYHGEVVPTSLKRLDVGGRDLDARLAQLLRDRGYSISMDRAFEALVLRDMKERCCYVAYDYAAELKKVNQTTLVRSAWARGGNSVSIDYDVTAHGNADLPGFENRSIPDKISFDSERFTCPEALFDPLTAFNIDFLIPGVHKMVQETIKAVPIDLKRAMYQHVALSGGTTLLPGFADRLRKELREIAPPSVEINIDDKPNRHLAVWIGGSVLAASKNFNFHWISREEYKEYGVELLHSTR